MAQHIPYAVNYANRQVDVELLQSVARPVDLQRVDISMVTQPSKIVAGIQKCVQRYTNALLTVLGSVAFDPAYGTDLLGDILGGRVYNEGTLHNSFALANTFALRQLQDDDGRTEIYGAVPDDEAIQDANLLDLSVDQGAGILYLRVQIVSRAGDNLEFVVPVTASR